MFKMLKERIKRILGKEKEKVIKRRIGIIKKEEGSFTVEATAISAIVILVVVCMIVYSFLLYDKNKVSSVINETICYANENDKINSGQITQHIYDELSNKLYITNIDNIASNLDSKGKLNIEISVKTNSKIYNIANIIIKKKYTIIYECSANCADIAEKVREK